MILYLDTSTKEARVWLDDQYYVVEMGRDMGRDLLKFIKDCLAQQGSDWQNLTGLAFYAGPGSFTGLRIGASIINTLADSLNIPIVQEKTENDQTHWRTVAKSRLAESKNDQIVIPFYGGGPNITKPRK